MAMRLPLRVRHAAATAAAAAACTLVASCATVSVDYDYDPAATFDRLATFAWHSADDRPDGPSASPLRDKAIREAVTDELRARGFSEVTAAAPPAAPGPPPTAGGPGAAQRTADFTVSAFTALRQRVDVWYPPYGPWWGWGCWHSGWHSPWWGSPWVTTWDEGTLVLDIADGRTGAPLWRGTATAAVESGMTPEERHARLRASVRDVLAKFPPPR
jgi:uncharacterized protein DUF4136